MKSHQSEIEKAIDQVHEKLLLLDITLDKSLGHINLKIFKLEFILKRLNYRFWQIMFLLFSIAVCLALFALHCA
jgi:hypothetical protein